MRAGARKRAGDRLLGVLVGGVKGGDDVGEKKEVQEAQMGFCAHFFCK